MSGGRFKLGLGTGQAEHQDRYAARWLPPAAGMKEYVGALRAIFRSFRNPREPLNFVGEYYRFTRLQPFFNPGPIEAPDVPIMLGAVGEDARRRGRGGRRHAHAHQHLHAYLREAILPNVAAGAAKRDAGLH